MFDLFYRDKRLLVLAISLIFVAGLTAMMVLPRMEDPVLSERLGIINTVYPGADASRVESLLTEPLEKELREVEEIMELRSISRFGISTVTIELRDEVTGSEVDEIWSRIRDRIDDATLRFPTGVLKPKFDRIDMKAYALLVAVIWEQDDDPSYGILSRTTEDLADQLRNISGTEAIDTFGNPDEEILVMIRETELASLGLTVSEIARQVQASDSKVSAGLFRGQRNQMLLEVGGELDSLTRVENMPIHYGESGQFVRLGDVGEVKKHIRQPASSIAIINGKPAIVLGAQVRSEKRVDQWAESAAGVLAKFEAQLPRGLRVKRVFDQTPYVAERLATLAGNLVMGAAGVVLVILLLMGWRSALIVGFALPLSAMMVLTGMQWLEIPIHQMSVTGLIIALGLLIDNAIVIVDEVRTKMQSGISPRESVRESCQHLAVPLFGSTLTTALAFAPIALMPGPAGEFVGSIAISVILAISSSFLLAMTIIPTLSAFWPNQTKGDANTPSTASWWQNGFRHQGLTQIYRCSLDFLFRRPVLAVCLGLFLPVAGYVQSRHLVEQFFPPADRDQFRIEMELSSQASMEETQKLIEEISAHVQQEEQVSGVDWFLGESAPSFYYNVVMNRKGTPHYAQALVQLNSPENVQPLINRLQQQLDQKFSHSRVLVRQLEQGPPFEAPLEVRIYGPDLKQLHQSGDEMRKILSQVSTVVHTRSDMGETAPKLSFRTDEEEVRLAKLDHRMIAGQLDAALEGSIGGSILEETEELPVRIRVSKETRSHLDSINSFDLVPNPGSRTPSLNQNLKQIPLTAIGQFKLQPEISVIPHFNQQRMNEIHAYLPAGVLAANAQAEIEERLAAANFQLPAGYSYEFGGETAERDGAVGGLMSQVPVLLVLMIATLVLSFHSFRAAAIIAVVGLMSVGLGVGSLWFFGFPFGFMSIVGCMGLAGVAINDAIVVLAAIRENKLAAHGDVNAMRDVVLKSTRHVVATSITTMAGFTPLVLNGGSFWPPMAIAIAGGVGGATLLALYFVPAAYLLLIGRNYNQDEAGQRMDEILSCGGLNPALTPIESPDDEPPFGDDFEETGDSVETEVPESTVAGVRSETTRTDEKSTPPHQEHSPHRPPEWLFTSTLDTSRMER